MDLIYWTWSKKNERLEKSLKSERPNLNVAETEINVALPETLEEKLFKMHNQLL